jgi:hypothetical protein
MVLLLDCWFVHKVHAFFGLDEGNTSKYFGDIYFS